VRLAQRQGAIGLQVNLRVVASIQLMSPYVVDPCSQSIGQTAKLDGDLLLTGFFREGAERLYVYRYVMDVGTVLV
jgi:hypothetical protein